MEVLSDILRMHGISKILALDMASVTMNLKLINKS